MLRKHLLFSSGQFGITQAILTLGILVGNVFLIIGISSSFIDTPFTTMLQNLIPNEMRSIVFSSIGFLFKASVPGGIALYGLLMRYIIN